MATGSCFNAAGLALMADWHRAFDDPIPVPDGRVLKTLYDAGHYATALPKATCYRCHGLTHARRHRHRTIPHYHRLMRLRRKIGASLVPFSRRSR